MRGSVAEDGSEPLLPLWLLAGAGNGSGEGAPLEVEAVIDTGFDGELALLSTKIRRLGYPYAGSAGGTLADGSEAQFDFHGGRVLWHGAVRPTAVIAAEGQPLIGMALLRGSRLCVEGLPRACPPFRSSEGRVLLIGAGHPPEGAFTAPTVKITMRHRGSGSRTVHPKHRGGFRRGLWQQRWQQ